MASSDDSIGRALQEVHQIQHVEIETKYLLLVASPNEEEMADFLADTHGKQAGDEDDAAYENCKVVGAVKDDVWPQDRKTHHCSNH